MKSFTFAFFSLMTAQFSSVCLAAPSSLKYIDNFPVAKAAAPLALGVASTYGALGATTLTSTGQTVIKGDIGTYPGTSITGFPPGVYSGNNTAGTASQPQAACLIAYNNAVALTPTQTLTGSDLSGLSLAPGVYSFPGAAATLASNLTLDGASNANGQWVFQISTTLITAASSNVFLINGAKACNVYFIVGSSGTLGDSTSLQGNLLAYTSISVDGAASNKGTLCALNGAVTLINNALTSSSAC